MKINEKKISILFHYLINLLGLNLNNFNFKKIKEKKDDWHGGVKRYPVFFHQICVERGGPLIYSANLP